MLLCMPHDCPIRPIRPKPSQIIINHPKSVQIRSQDSHDFEHERKRESTPLLYPGCRSVPVLRGEIQRAGPINLRCSARVLNNFTTETRFSFFFLHVCDLHSETTQDRTFLCLHVPRGLNKSRLKQLTVTVIHNGRTGPPT